MRDSRTFRFIHNSPGVWMVLKISATVFGMVLYSPIAIPALIIAYAASAFTFIAELLISLLCVLESRSFITRIIDYCDFKENFLRGKK